MKTSSSPLQMTITTSALIALALTPALAPAETRLSDIGLAALESVSEPHEIPFMAPQGQLSRMSMLEEMGSKHPAMDCSDRCIRSSSLQSRGCHLGLIGATYVLTGFQKKTGRSEMPIWHIPNSSLNVEAYAYMKEMEAGISCEKSPFIAKFPTRKPLAGESAAPLSRAEVCQAWKDYFRAAGNKARKYDDSVQYVSNEERAAYPTRIAAAEKQNREIEKIQALMWKAHTMAILHSYWQYLHTFKRSNQMSVPELEYKMWMGWNRLVGNYLPQMNLNSCAKNSEFLAYQLMPDCLVGTTRPDGTVCKGQNAPGSFIMGHIQGTAFSIMQSELATTDFPKALSAFASNLKLPAKYRWPKNMTER